MICDHGEGDAILDHHTSYHCQSYRVVCQNRRCRVSDHRPHHHLSHHHAIHHRYGHCLFHRLWYHHHHCHKDYRCLHHRLFGIKNNRCIYHRISTIYHGSLPSPPSIRCHLTIYRYHYYRLPNKHHFQQ